MKGDVSVYRLFCQSGDSADSLLTGANVASLSSVRLTCRRPDCEISSTARLTEIHRRGGEEDVNTERGEEQGEAGEKEGRRLTEWEVWFPRGVWILNNAASDTSDVLQTEKQWIWWTKVQQSVVFVEKLHVVSQNKSNQTSLDSIFTSFLYDLWPF